jgi:hypothetical protein
MNSINGGMDITKSIVSMGGNPPVTGVTGVIDNRSDAEKFPDDPKKYFAVNPKNVAYFKTLSDNMPSAPPIDHTITVPTDHTITVPTDHTYAPIESLPMIEAPAPQNVTIKNKTNLNVHHHITKEEMKNPLVISLIVLACIIVILIVIFITIIILGKKKNKSSSSSSSGGNNGHHKFLALRHHRKKPKNKFEHGDHNSGNDPSGWQLYTLEGCGYCTKQMKELKGFNTFVKYERGNSTPIINNIVGELYPREKMTGFPLWYNSNTKEVKMGYQQDICNLNPKISTANC